MKYLISIAIAVAAFYVVGLSLESFSRMRGDNVGISALIAGFIAFMSSLYKINTGKSSTSIASDVIGAVKDIKENVESNLEDKKADLYATAEEEYDNGKIDKGLLSQALVNAKGDEKLRKVEYMKLRVKRLKKNV